MATEDYTQPSLEQMRVAFGEITGIARTLQKLLYGGIDSASHEEVIVMAGMLVAQIGWMADRCVGFEFDSPEGWLLPTSWMDAAPKAGLNGARGVGRAFGCD